MKIGRNDRCPCGSGRKYKHCCYLKSDRGLSALEDDAPPAATRNPDEVDRAYVFRVELEDMPGRDYPRPVSRTIRIGGDRTLYDLHLAIQRAFGWDNDHMFSFYMSGKLHDDSSEYKGDPLGEWAEYALGDRSRPAADTEIRDLGLRARRKFAYLFDYGDMLLHRITVVSARAAEPGESPEARVIAEEGVVPPQYWSSGE